MSDTVAMTVMVTGIGGGGHGEQILKALRLASRRYHIVGADTSSLCANRGDVDVFECVPPGSSAGYVDRILTLARDHGARVVFHGSEPEMKALASASERFRAAGIYVPVNPPELLAICQDKMRTMRFLEAQGVRVPRSREITSAEDLRDFDALPAVLKPSVGGGGSANTFIAQSRAELEAFGFHLLTIYDRFLVQEYVGTPDAEFTVGVLFGGDGSFLNSIAVKRVISNALSVRLRVPNRSGRAELGTALTISSGISQGIVGHWPEVTAACERIAAALHPTAPINIQCRIVDGAVVPFEINPRFSGTTSIRAMVGYNEPDTLIRRDVLGETIEVRFPYREATIMRRLAEYEITTEVQS